MNTQLREVNLVNISRENKVKIRNGYMDFLENKKKNKTVCLIIFHEPAIVNLYINLNITMYVNNGISFRYHILCCEAIIGDQSVNLLPD